MNIHNIITVCMQHDILSFIHDSLHQCCVDASKQILRMYDVMYIANAVSFWGAEGFLYGFMFVYMYVCMYNYIYLSRWRRHVVRSLT